MLRDEVRGGDDSQQLQGRTNLKWGHVKEIDPTNGRCRVECSDNDGMMSYWLQILYPKTHEDKFYWMPDLEEYVTFQLDENGEEGTVFGAFYSKTDQPPVNDPNKFHIRFKDETTFEYDRELNKLTIDFSDGSLIEYDGQSSKLHIHSNGQVNVQAVQQIRLKSPDIRLIKAPVPPRS